MYVRMYVHTPWIKINCTYSNILSLVSTDFTKPGTVIQLRNNYIEDF